MKRHWPNLLSVTLLVAAATVVGRAFAPQVNPTNLVMAYLLAVVVAGLWRGRTAAVLTSILGVSAFDFFLVPPYLSFDVSDAQYLITFAAFLVVALVIGTLTGRLRDHAAALRRREHETAALYGLSRSMVAAHDPAEIADAIITHMVQVFACQVAVLLPDPRGKGLQPVGPGFPPTDAELRIAAEALATGSERPGYLLLRTAQGVVGLLVLRDLPDLPPDEQRLLEAFAAQAAVAVERAQLSEAARQAALLVESDRLKEALLHSISHTLRTPLASIIGSLSALAEPSGARLDDPTRIDLLETAREEADRLNLLVGNLLDMTRLQSGHMKLNRDWYDLEEVLGIALGQMARRLADRDVTVDLPDGFPMLSLDQVMIVQVLNNLLENAAKYSPSGSPIAVTIQEDGQRAVIAVADRGPGIPADQRERVFDKFYRLASEGTPGTGLGLPICKGIVAAHHGQIWTEPNPGGGSRFAFSLPLHPEEVDHRG